ncbi:hypothetical protein HY632_03705 [Candidatus Uhrbacteria bacterium]|nr:hypothetical protein [Candidatus Uhrbacteria bacterium]
MMVSPARTTYPSHLVNNDHPQDAATMPRLVDVAILQRIPRVPGFYTYSVPSGRDDVLPGVFVRVQFRRRWTWAVVLRPQSVIDFPLSRIQPIHEVAEGVRLTTTELRALHRIAACTRTAISTVAYLLLPSPPRRAVERRSDSPIAAKAEKHLTTHGEQPPTWATRITAAPGVVSVTYRSHEQRLRALRDCAHSVIARGRSPLLLIPHRPWHGPIVDILREAALPFVLLDRAVGKGAQWQSFVASRSKPVVLVSTRSGALYAPELLGAILVDESTSDDHKQEDMEPRFDGRVVAMRTAEDRGIPYIAFSSAARTTEWVQATRRIDLQHTEPLDMRIVSLTGHWRTGGRGILTEELRAGIAEALTNHRVAVLLHNRRGRMARVVCGDCQRTIDCPVCSNPLAEYDDALRCRFCQTTHAGVHMCPFCNSPRLAGRGIGTSGLATALAAAFPGVTIARVDRDAPGVPHPEASIVVGSARFLAAHAPTFARPVGLVAIPFADHYVRGDQFDGRERLFQGLRDAAVWATTWHAPLLLQTLDPQQSVLRALHGDPSPWYREELEERTMLQYPPAIRLLRCDADGSVTPDAIAACRRLLESRHRGTLTSIDGPYEFGMRRGRRVMSILLRFPVTTPDDRITAVIADLPDTWRVNLDPIALHA